VRRLPEAVFETRTLARSAGKGAPMLALGAEVAVGDVARPETLAPALEGCAGVFSAFSASTDRQAWEVEYRGNVNLLSAGGRRAALRLQLARARGSPAGAEGRGLQGEGALPGGAARRWRRLRERFASARCSWRPCSWPLAGPWPSYRSSAVSCPLDLRGQRGPRRRPGIRVGHNRPPRARQPRLRHLSTRQIAARRRFRARG
jgi:hypothetical protein